MQMAAWNRWREIEWDLKGPLSPGAVQKLTRRAHIKRGIINDITGRVEGQLYLWRGSTVCLQKTGENESFSCRLVDIFSGDIGTIPR